MNPFSDFNLDNPFHKQFAADVLDLYEAKLIAGAPDPLAPGRLLLFPPALRQVADPSARAVLEEMWLRMLVIQARAQRDHLKAGERALKLLRPQVAAFSGVVTTGGSIGTGWWLTPRHIVTAAHVVEGAELAGFTDAWQQRWTVRVLGAQADAAICEVLPVEGQAVPAVARLAEQDPAPGDWVAAYGAPWGLSDTMTTGHITAPTRLLWDQELAQTDAAVNPGNSGGPVVDEDAVVQALVSSKVVSQGADNTAFLTPASVIRSLAVRLGVLG